jgi:hypothetical protein
MAGGSIDYMSYKRGVNCMAHSIAAKKRGLLLLSVSMNLTFPPTFYFFHHGK